MKAQENLTLYDELDDEDLSDTFVNPNLRRQRFPARNPKKIPETVQKFVHSQDDSRQNFSFTYHASRHEAGWLLDSLGEFYEHGWISDVLRMIKGGKEASVYLCQAGVEVDAPYVAAKVYRPRQLRNLKNDQLYRVGRQELDENGNRIVDNGMLKALHRRSNYGEDLRHQSWIAYEFQALKVLYTAGADVPKPCAMENNAILMDYIGDMDMAAPTLNSIELALSEAKPLFERVVHNIDLMLSNDRIHSDLSAYNILYWDGKITLIDFPQVISPGGNPLSWRIFERDVTRVCEYFIQQGLRLDPLALATELWTAHGHKVTQDVHPRDLDPDRPEDRRTWERQK